MNSKGKVRMTKKMGDEAGLARSPISFTLTMCND